MLVHQVEKDCQLDDGEARMLKSQQALKQAAQKHKKMFQKEKEPEKAKKANAKVKLTTQDELKTALRKERDMHRQNEDWETYVREHQEKLKNWTKEFQELHQLIIAGPAAGEPGPPMDSLQEYQSKMRLLELDEQINEEEAAYKPKEDAFVDEAINLTPEEERILRGYYAGKKDKGLAFRGTVPPAMPRILRRREQEREELAAAALRDEMEQRAREASKQRQIEAEAARREAEAAHAARSAVHEASFLRPGTQGSHGRPTSRGSRGTRFGSFSSDKDTNGIRFINVEESEDPSGGGFDWGNWNPDETMRHGAGAVDLHPMPSSRRRSRAVFARPGTGSGDNPVHFFDAMWSQPLVRQQDAEAFVRRIMTAKSGEYPKTGRYDLTRHSPEVRESQERVFEGFGIKGGRNVVGPVLRELTAYAEDSGLVGKEDGDSVLKKVIEKSPAYHSFLPQSTIVATPGMGASSLAGWRSKSVPASLTAPAAGLPPASATTLPTPAEHRHRRRSSVGASLEHFNAGAAPPPAAASAGSSSPSSSRRPSVQRPAHLDSSALPAAPQTPQPEPTARWGSGAVALPPMTPPGRSQAKGSSILNDLFSNRYAQTLPRDLAKLQPKRPAVVALTTAMRSPITSNAH
eukprot:NODE_358_length_2177_cov_9.474624_g286_i0.p1 GENE.NODE_358_length_2177_cov_9.474624_g286_i0~~NODE_358_length_2177_cov_9.474624_g286_i0.p1  ORF type:complete len:699 (+),score=209.47 NODE_358_length_2177_cov_9.474624_g286_i0:204-2099(+)